MNLPSDSSPSASTTDRPTALRPPLGLDLRSVVTIAIGATLLLSLASNLFVYVQMRGARAQLANARTVARSLSEQYQAKEPNMRQFVSALISFSSTHPEFQPILARHRAGLAPFFADAGILRPPTNPNAAPAPNRAGTPPSTPGR